ncbi:MAG: hypothetical protein GWN62_09475 [Aliifodinibius sp.]|nr:hypothetical protein [Fodinibius sp.]
MVNVNWGVSISEGSNSFSFEELNTTKEEWSALSEDEKREKVQEAVDELPDAVCLIVDNWED